MNVFNKLSIRTLSALAILLFSLGGIIYYFRGGREVASQVYEPVHQAVSSIEIPGVGAPLLPAPITLAQYSTRSAYGPLKSYLSDVEFDGAFQMDAKGHLIRSKKIRQLFDFFLMAINDEGLSICSGRIEEMIAMSLAGEAKKEALVLWASYKAYRQALPDASGMNEYVTCKEGLAKFENILNDRIWLKRKHMAPENADLFFGEEEAYDRYMLARIRIQNDTSFTESEKTAAISALAARLPSSLSSLSQSEIENLEEVAFAAEVDQLKQAKDIAAVHALRESRYGREAAYRLAALDKKNDALKRRVEKFRRLKQTIMADPDLSPEEKTRQINDAEKKNFAEWERSIR